MLSEKLPTMMTNVITFRRQHMLYWVVLAIVGLIILRYSWNRYYPTHGRFNLKHYVLTDTPTSFSMKNKKFYVNGEPFVFLSGAVHYFRVVPEYWRDRLYKLKAAGLNTVETYVPWNKHEEIQGEFNFKGMFDIREFIQIAAELDLLVILRPGPYICSEWDFGGLPSWLLADPSMKIRTTYAPYITAVDRYFKELFAQITDLQFQNGGPIIMTQIENEYGSYGSDREYLKTLKKIMVKHGATELFFTSDNKHGIRTGSVPEEALTTGNFKQVESGTEIFNYLHELQPDKPLMVMEFWSGWFDAWGGQHQTWSIQEYRNVFEFILAADSSINIYMFHGGTNFGFMNGANEPEKPQTTSYDYDAPLSECGDTTDKYYATRKMIQQLIPAGLSKLKEPLAVPPNVSKAAYGDLSLESMMSLDNLLTLVNAPITRPTVVAMEMLHELNNGGGQGYGFILYRHSDLPKGQKLALGDKIHDRAIIMLNGKEVTTLDYSIHHPVVPLSNPNVHDVQEHNVLDVLVENMGRVNYAHAESGVMDGQRKGLNGAIKVDDKELTGFQIYPLEFKQDFLQRVLSSSQWEAPNPNPHQPTLYRLTLTVLGKPSDTFINMEGWNKGVVFVNSFNLGRYWKIGPTRTMYIPAPLLHTGKNEVLVFELHGPAAQITSVDRPRL